MITEKTIWKMPPHTAAKHTILKKYMEAWMPIMGSRHKRIVYIDAFSGPGVYEDGEDGSPIIIIKTAENHNKWNGELVCLFIDERKDRTDMLTARIKLLKIKKNITYDIMTDDCNNVISPLLDDLEKKGLELAPTFAFIDPFGYSDVSYDLIKKLLANEHCEVLITFMISGIVRNMSIDGNDENITSFFGTDKWKAARNITDKNSFLHDLYRDQLMKIGNSQEVFVRSFEMRNNVDKLSHYLFYATKHPLGLLKMKEAMWNVDIRGTFQFSDSTDPKQKVLFTMDQTDILEKQILKKFAGKTIKKEEISDFVIKHTAFLIKHLNKALKNMESYNNPKINIVGGRKKRGTYPDGTVIEFVN